MLANFDRKWAFTCESGTFPPVTVHLPVATPTPVLVFGWNGFLFILGGKQTEVLPPWWLSRLRGPPLSLGGDVINLQRSHSHAFSSLPNVSFRTITQLPAPHTLYCRTRMSFKQRDNRKTVILMVRGEGGAEMRRTNGWIQCGDTHAYTHSNEA